MLHGAVSGTLLRQQIRFDPFKPKASDLSELTMLMANASTIIPVPLTNMAHCEVAITPH